MGLQDKISPALAPGLPEALDAAGIAFEIGPDGIHCSDAQADKLASIVASYTDADALKHVLDTRLAELADIRWQHETSTFLVGGIPISADDRGKILITAAADLARREEQKTFQFKADDGQFLTLDGAAIIAIYSAMASHVQACFSNEASLASKLTAAVSIDELRSIDLTQGWPN